MASNKAEKEDLKKLENEAYNELCQIIAEAMQLQDIALLDQRIVNWKKKYKKLLDSNSSASANFKKRIEYLLNEYYSEITQYILKQIRKSEQKRVENQSKALRKLRYIIDETDDLSLLKKKVKEWQDKYPITGFLNMYQKRIKVYTSEKHLKEHAFDQDMAFRDLYYITKLNRTYDELKEEVEKWEDKYSINDKFKLDDFIKHQSEVTRYASDDYLKNIAHADNSSTQELPLQEIIVKEVSGISNLGKQTAAYSSLMSIVGDRNNIDEMFNWVYKNKSIKFNDEYKGLILAAISRDYSPRYLNSLSIPKISMSNSLSFDEYQNINEIKRYTVISYFNLLLPPEIAVSNDYFTKNIQAIYHKSKSAHFSNDFNELDKNLEKSDEVKIVSTEAKIPELEIDLSEGQVFNIPDNICVAEKAVAKKAEKTLEKPEILDSDDTDVIKIVETIKKPIDKEPEIIVPEDSKEEISKNITNELLEKSLEAKEQHPNVETDISNEISKQGKDSEPAQNDNTNPLEIAPSDDAIIVSKPSEEKPVVLDKPTVVVSEAHVKSKSEDLNASEKPVEIITDSTKSEENNVKYTLKEETPSSNSTKIEEVQEELSEELYEESEDLTPDTVIAFSPQFFEIINNKVKMQEQQTTIITMINSTVDQYMSIDSNSIDTVKTRNDLD